MVAFVHPLLIDDDSGDGDWGRLTPF
jgi:hypothetical protein